jgi:hypothetical protein
MMMWAAFVVSQLWSVGVAHAAIPVLHGEEKGSVATGQVMVSTGLEASELEAVSTAALVEGSQPAIVGQGRVSPCAAPSSSMGAVAELVSHASSSLAYMETDKALEALEHGAAALGCLSEPLATDVAARLFYLQGLAAYQVGDRSAAWAGFYRAHVFEPQLAWDENFSPDGKPIFDLAASQLRKADRVELSLLPPFAKQDLLIDGHPVAGDGSSVQLVPGAHIVQILGEPTLSLEVQLEQGGGALLVVPQAMPADMASWAARAKLRASLSLVLSLQYKQGQEVYITALDGVWKTVVGSESFEEIVAPRKDNPVDLQQVPAGSVVTWVAAEGGTVGRARVPWEAGEPEASLGLGLEPAVRLEGLQDGPYRYSVDHPLLGLVEDVFVVQEGQQQVVAFDWQGAPGAAWLQERYAAHLEAERAAIAAQRARKVGRGTAVAGGVLGATALGFATRGLLSQLNVNDLHDQMDAASLIGDADAHASLAADRDSALGAARVSWAVAGAGLGLGVISGSISFGQLRRAGQHSGELPVWAPRELDVEPAPGVEPLEEPSPSEEEAPVGEDQAVEPETEIGGA